MLINLDKYYLIGIYIRDVIYVFGVMIGECVYG